MLLSRKNVIISFCLALLLLVMSNGLRAATHDPALNWYTLENEHFYVHYHDDLKPTAEKVMNYLPGIYNEITGYFLWQPKGKTHIILTDGFDLANGFATPLPFNQITIFTSPPVEVSSLEDFDNWLYLVLKHEYVHIVHLDKAGGLPLKLRQIFGRLPGVPFEFLFPLFPNLFLPNWFTEGIATQLETDYQTGSGRGQANYFRGLMRMEVANGIKPIDTVNLAPVSWPSRTSWYLYGVYFFKYLEHTYGKDRIKALVHDYSQFPLPFFVNDNATRVLGKDYYTLWDEFEQYLENDFRPEIERVKKHGAVQGRQLTHSGYGSGNSRVDAEGNVYYVLDDQLGPAKLMRLDAATKQSDVVAKEIDGKHFDWNENQGIVISQLEYHKNVDLRYDLYHIDPQTGKETRLTNNGRYHMASWSPNGNRIAAVHRKRGQFSLHLLDRNGVFQESLWQAADNEEVIIGGIDWSPVDDQIIASVWRKPLGWNIEQFDLQSRRWIALTRTDNIETEVQYTADGNHIVFSADYNGIYNIYQMDLQTHDVIQLTRVIGGAFAPSLGPKGQTLYYNDLTANGNNLFSLPYNPLQTLHVGNEEINITDTNNELPQISYDQHDYTARSYIRPRWWLPLVITNDEQNIFGINTAGQDPLGWHRYMAALAFDFNHQLPMGNLVYVYDRFTPTIQLGLNHFYTLSQFGSNDLARINILNTFQLSVGYPIFDRQMRQKITLHAFQEIEREYIRHVTLSPFETQRDTYAALDYEMDTTEKGMRAISPHSGVDGLLRYMYQFEDEHGITGKRAIGDTWLYAPLFSNESVIATRLVAGIQSAGMSSFEFDAMPEILESFYAPTYTRFTLRGYPSGLTEFRGNALNLATLEWRTPLATPETGIMMPPVGIRQIHGKLFADAGRIWQWGDKPPSLSRSIGMELTLSTTLGYRFNLDVILGIAKGLDEFGEDQAYLSVKAAEF